MREIREHLQPPFIEVRTLGPVLHPDGHFYYVFGTASGGLKNKADRSEHPFALRLDSFRHFSGIQLLT